MSNLTASLDALAALDGAMCAALVDVDSGMTLGTAGSGVDLEVAAAGNTEVVRAKLRTIRALNLDDEIEDMLITLGKQYHIIRPMRRATDLFLYVVFDRNRANLAMARRKVFEIEAKLEI
ncbi:hypothetical protein [Coralloluteibacterium stylophorae]|uniref:Roadblock/LC7 domain-containing protein n=1 Tax=Coralloluteibacterium stylophorae TaxID=1776034 RepID=A0A8J7VU79_9GAMM|nr:hypothetical protein [Coralloluteibacterium stylophorae]MBS7459028.1 hypothetical protein [Coralloluteibacterium stylophorae]